MRKRASTLLHLLSLASKYAGYTSGVKVNATYFQSLKACIKRQHSVSISSLLFIYLLF